MSKAQRDAAKDHGGFVGGVLKGGRRKIDTVELRSMVALDGDRIDRTFLENYEANAPYTSCLYTTHSSTEENPRARLVFPLTRDITSEEFVAVSRYLAQMRGIDYFDECSYQPNQLMYWPSSPQNGVFVFKEVEKDWLDPDAILSAHPEWTDPTRLPTSSRESKANTLKTHDVGETRCNELAVKVYGICSKDSNAMKSDNPKSGFYEADTTRTLDANGGNPSCNQGGMAVVALEDNGARPSHQGSGYSEDDVSFTLNATEQHAVAYGIDRATYNMGHNAKFVIAVEEEDFKQFTMIYELEEENS